MQPVTSQLQRSLGDEFEVIRPLGEGSFAEVFLARERVLDRPVAIKILRPTLAADETARRRFLREARLSARIRHPNVVEVYRVGELEPGGRPYLVMEYVDGVTHADLLAAGGPLGEEEVRRVLSDICGALEAAHRLGIIHRDLRPANIMRTRDGERIVLTDFGLAGILETGGQVVTRLTAVGEVLGDERYAAPEQLLGEAILPGTDLYALAITAYELLTGGGPFEAKGGRAGLVRAHLEQAPTPIRALRPDVSAALEDLLLRCLRKRPDQRPSADMVRTRLAAGPGGGPMPGGAVERFLAELKRRKVYRVGAAYGAFVLVVLAIVDGALPALPFEVPPWTDTVLVTGALAGLPVALILTWLYDLTAGGVIRTPSLPGRMPWGTRVLLVAAILVVLAGAAILGWLFVLR